MATSFLFLYFCFWRGFYLFSRLQLYLTICQFMQESTSSGSARKQFIYGKIFSWYSLVKTLCFIAGLHQLYFWFGLELVLQGKSLYTPWFRYVLGGIVILLRIHQIGLINVNNCKSQRVFNLKRIVKSDFLNATLGITFSFGWTVQDQS